MARVEIVDVYAEGYTAEKHDVNYDEWDFENSEEEAMKSEVVGQKEESQLGY